MNNHLHNHWDFLHKSEWINRNMTWILTAKPVTRKYGMNYDWEDCDLPESSCSPSCLLIMPVSPEAHNLLPPPPQTETDEGGGWLPGSSSPWEGGKYCSHSQTPTEAAHSTYRPRQQYQLIYYRTWCSQMYIYSISYCVDQRYNSKSKITSWLSYLVTLYIHILKSSIVIIS